MRPLAVVGLALALLAHPAAPQSDAFHMTVRDAFTVTGRGVVVTGVVEGGPVAVGDVICLRPADGEPRELTVTAIERFREVLEVAEPGAAVGLLFEGIEDEDVEAGDRLTTSCGARTTAPG
jgi:elongation factor Tu